MTELFARKLIRVSTRIPEKDIKNEALVFSAIQESGGHENIIVLLDHGWLTGSLNTYFIDMELASLTLADYIKYMDETGSSSIDTHEIQPSPPVFIHARPNFKQRIQSMWAIGTHIAHGLDFMHSRKLAHRDLKPSNGNILCEK
jgi:serine/threonine protein kinase